MSKEELLKMEKNILDLQNYYLARYLILDSVPHGDSSQIINDYLSAKLLLRPSG
jgi:hypothetical protein